MREEEQKVRDEDERPEETENIFEEIIQDKEEAREEKYCIMIIL